MSTLTDAIAGAINKPQLLIIGDETMNDKSAAARAILGLAATIAMQHQPLPPMRKEERSSEQNFHGKADFHNLEKIPSDEAFITSGYDELTERWYAAIMRRLMPENIGKDGNPWAVAAKCNYGFDTAMEAKLDASKQFPLLAVISDDGNDFTYPGYTETVERKAKIIREADERRKKRDAKRAENMRKSQEGRKR